MSAVAFSGLGASEPLLRGRPLSSYQRPPRADLPAWYNLPWIYPSPNHQPIDPAGRISTPIVGASATVLSYQVPIGYDGVINRISHNITGGGFVQGSGDLIWSITINDRPYQNYGSILFEFGTIVSGLTQKPVDSIIIRSRDTIRYRVENVAYLGGGTFTICTLGGWIWPKSEVTDAY